MSASRFAITGVAAWLLLAPAVTAAAEARLADAAERKSADEIRTLLDAKADVNAHQADGMTALHWAAQQDDVGLVKRLIAAGADAKAATRFGVTPLALACTNGDAAIVEMLLEAGADPNSFGPDGATALLTASRTGRAEVVEVLLAHGADANSREGRQQTALMWAAAEGNVEVVNVLLKARADFRTPLASGFTPLALAVREGRLDTAIRLIRAGADVNEAIRPKRGGNPPMTPLLLAVENGHFELAVALLKTGARPNDQPAGYTALHAITWVRKPIRGDGNPPPIGSGRMGSLEFVRHLAASGADVNARLENGTSGRGQFTTTGSTPFLLAARASDVPMMRLLIELGADPNVTNVDHCSPLLAAAGVGALGNGDEAAGTEDEAREAVRALLDLGADINAVDGNGETAIHGAAYQSWATVVDLLAQRGADVALWNRANKAGWTPLMIAQGHRPGNFRPAPDTITAIERAMRAGGVAPP